MTASVVIAIDCRPIIEDRISGVSVYAHAMIAAMRSLPGVKLQLFYQNYARAEHLHEKYPDIVFHRLSSRGFHLKSVFRAPALPETYFKQQPDLIWLPDRRPFYRTDIPVVMTIHDRVPQKAAASLSWRSRLWHALFSTERLLKQVDGVLCPSFTIEQEIPRDIPRRVTYEGSMPVKGEMPPQMPKDFSLFIAPNDPRKGVKHLLQLAADFPKDAFVWIGSSSEDSRFAKRNYKIPKNIVRLHEVSEAQKWGLLRRARLLLALSDYEGFDLPVLEAVEAKCPVILSDISVHRELYTKAEFVSGYEEIFTAYVKSKHGKLPVPKARGHYSWTEAAHMALLFFRRVIENKNGHDGRNRHRDDRTQDS